LDFAAAALAFQFVVSKIRQSASRQRLDVVNSRPWLLSFPFQFHEETCMSSSLEGRIAVVFGVANKRSIAWSIAQGLHNAGAKLAISYQNERMELEAKDLILSLPGAEAFMCDVSNDAEIERVFGQLKERYGKLHVLVHSVAFAPADELKGEFINTTREGFRIALDVSVYSLIALARAAAPLMEDGGSIITMTYYAADKVVPHYNVMAVAKAALECSVRYLSYDLGKKKIRVNAISAGPLKTLAARGISGLGDMLKSHAERAPLGRNVDVSEVGSTGVFLSSDASSGITGEVIYVDCGYNIMGF
jgi:enoyl-[acyl-carrier protein] reductase I